MLLFRSEEHVERWCRMWNQPFGEILSLAQGWALAQEWYGPDRRDPAWRRKSPEEAAAIFNRIGLTSSFWKS